MPVLPAEPTLQLLCVDANAKGELVSRQRACRPGEGTPVPISPQAAQQPSCTTEVNGQAYPCVVTQWAPPADGDILVVHNGVASKIDPMDVPAIQETAAGNEPVVLRDPLNCVDGYAKNVLYGDHCASRKFWTCADKRNILMMGEDGTKWCHRVNSQ